MIRLRYTFLLLILTTISCSKRPASIVPVNLRTEYLSNPSGLDMPHPRFSWELSSAAKDQSQSAYRILVASDSTALSEDKADVWDSGKTKTDRSGMIACAGEPLSSGNKYFWKVKVWDHDNNESDWSPVASLSTGLFNREDWQAQWIGAAPENVPYEKRYNRSSGFQSEFSAGADDNKWVMVDLGKEENISEIRLFPTESGSKPAVHLFPVRFAVEASSTENFTNARKIADESAADFVKQDLKPYVKTFDPVKARYIRVSVSRLAPADSARYAFSLAELQALTPEKQNVALHKKTSASDTYLLLRPFSYDNWLPARLTDGFLTPSKNYTAYSIPIPPSPLLRKTFAVDKKITSATLHTSALGIYEVYLNGRKVGDQVLAPEWTDYHKRVQYQSYDVTGYLKQGQNAIGAMLADGWYAGAIFAHPDRGPYGFDRRFLGQLHIRFDDGSKAIIASDGSWKIWENGPVQNASIFNGETYDARLEQNGWSEASFDDQNWRNVTTDPSITVQLSAQINEPIKVVQEIKPVAITAGKKGTYIVDLGQIVAGWVALSLPYNPGGPITLRHGEVLDDAGELYTTNLRAAKQIDQYIPGKETSITYEPRFTYHGFRFVEISGLTRELHPDEITGKVVASASPVTGHFECSNHGLTKLWQNILWTQRGNMHSVPTDCPQRDERAGWMGDAQVFSQTAIYNLDMGAFFTKWTRDIRDSQTPDGRFPDYAPQVGVWGNFYNSPGWGDAGVITPWRMYQNYGDTTVLARQYPAMKAFVESIRSQNPDLVWRKARGNMYGDWLNGNTIIADDYPKEGGKVPDDVYSTAFFAYSTSIVAKVARLLDKKDETAYYDSLAAGIKEAFIKSFVAADGAVTGNTQAGYAIALDFDLIPDALKEKSAQKMVEALKPYDNRISTGIQTTIRLMNQLTAFGYSDLAYQLIESHRFPSWLYSVDQGATTIWERWDGYVKGRGFQNPGMNSFNHYAIGAVGEWMYRSILGINPDEAGYKTFTIHPRPGGSLTWAKGAYHSIAGKIDVSWKKENGSFLLDVDIPANTRATVVLPAGKAVLESGKDVKSVPRIQQKAAGEKEIRLLVPSGQYHFSVAL
ncbi:hypothetical protein GCM10023091_22920 [Ravibacter arvi]|uniref:alpha-L-rhamnosidase n=1 Tax=Ravibacter arvi TaxID=2051041 RepID=A0ABP8LZU8_9BACT